MTAYNRALLPPFRRVFASAAAALLYVRRWRAVSQRDLAARSRQPISTISRWERGLNDMPSSAVRDLAATLSVRICAGASGWTVLPLDRPDAESHGAGPRGGAPTTQGENDG